MKATLKMGYIKEKYMITVEIFYMKVIFQIVNMMGKEKNIILMEILIMKVITKMVIGLEKENCIIIMERLYMKEGLIIKKA